MSAPVLTIEERIRASEALCAILSHLATVADDALTNRVSGLTLVDIVRLTPNVCVALSHHVLGIKYALPATWRNAAAPFNEEER
jgi:hypothetical protein